MLPALILAALAAVSYGADRPATPPAASIPQPTASCAPPSVLYRGVGYRVVHLRAHRAELGLRLRRPRVRDVGVLTSHTECRDVVVCVVGQPCEPPPASPATVSRVPVLRLARVSPGVALASDNGGVIYVAANRCVRAGVGPALAQCLRRARPSRPTAVPAAVDRESVVRALRAQGLAMTPLDAFQDAFFGRVRHAYSDGISIVEFASQAEAAAEAGRVSGDGYNYVAPDRIVHADWIDAPHFFLAGRTIVLYVGRDATVLQILRSTLGEQFAGR